MKIEVVWLTAREVALYMGVHLNTVKRLPASDLPFTRVVRRGDRRYHIEDVDSYLERRTVHA